MFKTIILTAFLLFGITIAQVENLNIKLSTKEGSKVDFSISNPTDKEIKFLKWGTPLDVVQDMFTIKNLKTNQEVKYTGIAVFRGEPTSEDYITIQSQETIIKTVDLSKSFEFTEEGEHSVELDVAPALHSSLYVNKMTTINIDNSILTEGLKNYLDELIKDGGIEKSRINCQSGDETHISNGVQNGARTAQCSANCMNANSCASLYTRWFGTMDAGRYSTVRGNFGRIASGLRGSFRVHCRPTQNCSGSIIAYVYPSDSARTIYLCNSYFSYRDKGHVMHHEMAHFDSVARTRDHCYGATNCLNLARSNPALAVACADNHALFGGECK